MKKQPTIYYSVLNELNKNTYIRNKNLQGSDPEEEK